MRSGAGSAGDVPRPGESVPARAAHRQSNWPQLVLGPDADDDLWELLPPAGPEPAEAAERREKLERRRAALSGLKSDEQRALLLRRLA
jgi:DNA-directed RNA polymerase specialized sigma24 family protein